MNKITLTDPIRDKIIFDLQKFFAEERDEHLGNIPAMLMLDFILEEIGPMIYNQALIDTHTMMTQKLDDIYLLELEDVTFGE